MLHLVEEAPDLAAADHGPAPAGRALAFLMRKAFLPVLAFYLSLTASFDGFRYLACQFTMAHAAEDAAQFVLSSPPDAGVEEIEQRLSDRLARSREGGWRPVARITRPEGMASPRHCRLLLHGRLAPLNPALKGIVGAWTFQRTIELVRP